MEDQVETRMRGALAGEAAHPDLVGDEHMIERAVHRAEEGAALGTIVDVGNGSRMRVEPPVRPFIVARRTS